MYNCRGRDLACPHMTVRSTAKHMLHLPRKMFVICAITTIIRNHQIRFFVALRALPRRAREGEAVLNDSPGDCQSRRTDRPAGDRGPYEVTCSLVR